MPPYLPGRQSTAGRCSVERHSLRCATPDIYELLKAKEIQAGHTKAEMHAEQQEVEKWLNCSDHEIECGHLNYRVMPQALQDILSEWDMDNDGTVSFEVLQRAAREHHNQRKQLKYARWLVGAMLLLLIVMAASSFVTSLAAMDMSKEIKASKKGQMMTRDGTPATISNSDMDVQGGTLVARGRGGGGQENASKPLATRPAETKKGMSSTIPDELFDEMTKLSIKSADGVSHMTLRIQGFTRVMTPSRCGSIVNLYSPLGHVALDDTDLHFDASLALHAEVIGFTLEEATMHGRRLSSTALIAGAFNFFEDYDWQCDSVKKPLSPSKPYIAKTLYNVPCLDTQHCVSSLYRSKGQQMLPGFDEETRSITVEETIAETDDVILSIKRYPNHPLQKLVEIIDHKARIHRRLQIFEGGAGGTDGIDATDGMDGPDGIYAQYCTAMNYSETGNVTDTLTSYYAVYLGIRTRPAVQFNLPYRGVVLPQRTVRAFRLQPRSNGALPLSIYYDDDAETLLPTRLFFDGAKDMDLNLEEIFVESIQHEASVAIAELRLSVDVTCSGNEEVAGLPWVDSPLTERTEDVEFYVNHWDLDNTSNIVYWENALLKRRNYENSDAFLVDDNSSRLLQGATVTYDNSSRALQVRRADTAGFVCGISVNLDEETYFALCTNLACKKLIVGAYSSTSPWGVEGAIFLGDPDDCSVGGEISLVYSVNWTKTYPLIGKVGFKLELKGTVGMEAKNFKQIVKSTKNRRRRRRTKASSYVSGGTSRTSPYTRRRNVYGQKSWGFQVYGQIALRGKAKLGKWAEVSLGGVFRMTFGPWPSPLEARMTASLSGEACCQVLFAKACAKFSIELFSVKL